MTLYTNLTNLQVRQEIHKISKNYNCGKLNSLLIRVEYFFTFPLNFLWMLIMNYKDTTKINYYN